jgi:hypothetical protein
MHKLSITAKCLSLAEIQFGSDPVNFFINKCIFVFINLYLSNCQIVENVPCIRYVITEHFVFCTGLL